MVVVVAWRTDGWRTWGSWIAFFPRFLAFFLFVFVVFSLMLMDERLRVVIYDFDPSFRLFG